MILDALFETRAARKLTGGSPQNPAYWVKKLFGGGSGTAAGVNVTEDSALEISAFFCGVSIICNWIKSMPLVVLRESDGKKMPATSHPAYRLLHRSPNPETTPSRFKWYLQLSKLLWGNGFAEIQRDGSNKPQNLWPIHPARVLLRRNDAGEIVYIVHGEGAQQMHAVPARDMIHTWDFSRDGIWGNSVVEMAAESMGLMIATDQSAAGFFGNGAQVSGAIKIPHKLTKDAMKEMRRTWDEAQSGPQNAHKLAIFHAGAEYQQMGMPVKDWQLIESRTFSVLEMSRWLLIAPYKLKEMTDATYDNITSQRLENVDESVLPRAIELEEECNRKLLPDSPNLFCKFNMRALLRGDPKARAEHYDVMQKNGNYSINDVLDFEDLNRIGPEGDKHRVMVTTMAIEDPPPEPKPAPGSPDTGTDDDAGNDNDVDGTDEERSSRLKDSYRIMFRDAAGRIIHKEADKIRRGLRKCGHDPDEFRAFMDDFYEKHRAFVRQAIGPAVDSYAHARCAAGDVDSVVESILSTSVGQTRGLIRDSENGDMPEAMEQRLTLWAKERPDAIAERCLE